MATYRRFKRERCQLQLNDWGRFQIQATESNTVFDQLKVHIFEPRARPINQRVFSVMKNNTFHIFGNFGFTKITKILTVTLNW